MRAIGQLAGSLLKPEQATLAARWPEWAMAGMMLSMEARAGRER